MISAGGSPVLSSQTYDSLPSSRSAAMTINGTMMKVAFLLSLVILSGSIAWKTAVANPAQAPVLMWGGLIGGLVIAIVTSFKKTWSPVTGPLYALVKGLFVGCVSALYASFYDGIVVQAVTLTLAVAFSMLALYSMRIIRPSQKFKAIVFSATGGVMLLYVVTIALGFAGMPNAIPMVHGNGAFGIGFSLFVVGLAAMNLIIDFEIIEEGSRRGAPKYMEWYAGFALLVTLIWLYVEMLRLLGKLRGRD